MSTSGQPTDSHVVVGLSASVTEKIVVTSVIFLLFLLFIFILIFIRTKRHLMAYTPQQTSRIHLVLAGAGNGAAHSYPLDSAVLNSIPIITFSSVDSGEGMDCAVCLSEFVDGEATRILPGCSHGFHLECIDMWFSSHSTCPICRRSVDAKMSAAAKSGNEILILAGSQQGGSSDGSIINSAFPSRQLQREIRANSAGEGSSNFSTRRPGRILVIDMPRFVTESSPSSLKCSGSTVAGEVKLPTPAVSRSLREKDIEKGAVAVVVTAGQVDDMTRGTDERGRTAF